MPTRAVVGLVLLISCHQQSISATLEFLQIVLYMANPNITAAKMASGSTTNNLVPRPMTRLLQMRYKSLLGGRCPDYIVAGIQRIPHAVKCNGA